MGQSGRQDVAAGGPLELGFRRDAPAAAVWAEENTRESLFDAMREAGFRRIKTRYLFRSRFARWLFRRCVYRGFKLPKIAYFPVLALLWISEALTFSGEGMFVYCEAHKKDGAK